MKIKVTDIPSEGLIVNASLPIEEIRQYFSRNDAMHKFVVKPASLELQISKVQKKVYVKGTLRTILRPDCDYCNDPFEFPLEASISQLLFPPELDTLRPVETYGETYDETYEVDRYDGVVVDLTPIVIEQMILALPMNFKCSDDCYGLCPICGANRRKNQCKCEVEKDHSPFSVLEGLKLKKTK